MPPRPHAVKYQQVRDYLRAVAAESQPGDPVPSERALSDRFGVSRMTVRQAVDTLALEGLLVRVQGSGTYVAPPKVDQQVRLASFTEEMSRRGMSAGSRVLAAERTVADAAVAEALGLPTGDPVLRLRRLRLADDEPMAVEEAWFHAHLVPGLLEPEPPTSVYDELGRRGLLPDWGEDTIDAGEADDDEAAHLTIGRGKPVLRITRRSFVGDLIIEFTRSAYRPDRYTLWVPVTRPAPRVRRRPPVDLVAAR